MVLKTKMMRSVMMGGVLSVAFALGGCDMATPSQVSINKIGIEQSIYTAHLPTDTVNENAVMQLADGYERNGQGALNVLIGYNGGVRGDDVRANRQARLYKQLFSEYGVRDVSIEKVPVDGVKITPQTVVSYKSLKAVSPEGCSSMPGAHGAQTVNVVEDYQIGCGIQDYTAKMVSRPADLLGRTAREEDGARRHGNVVEGYKDGIRNEPIEGIRASDVGE